MSKWFHTVPQSFLKTKKKKKKYILLEKNMKRKEPRPSQKGNYTAAICCLAS